MELVLQLKACARIFKSSGVKNENIIMLDSKGML